jgi:hypothetical protein
LAASSTCRTSFTDDTTASSASRNCRTSSNAYACRSSYRIISIPALSASRNCRTSFTDCSACDTTASCAYRRSPGGMAVA